MSTAKSSAVRGFTLIELLITIAMFSIIAAVAVPSFTETAATQRVRSLATDLHSALLLARSEAVKRNVDVAVQPAAAGWSKGWTVVDIGDAANPETISVRQDVPGAVSIAGPVGGVTFRNSGRLAAAAAIEVASSNVSTIKRCVRTDLSGRPHVDQGGCS